MLTNGRSIAKASLPPAFCSSLASNSGLYFCQKDCSIDALSAPGGTFLKLLLEETRSPYPLTATMFL
ncbi:MAG: hypothetical protein ACRC2R_14195 [Xenococcaceae cyanobacterium]